MPATVLAFPMPTTARKATRAVPTPAAVLPRRFPADARAALLSLAYRLPDCGVWFCTDDDGDEWAAVEDISPMGTKVLSVMWDGPRMVLMAGALTEVGTYDTARELVEAIRRVWGTARAECDAASEAATWRSLIFS